jgi:hypothetical protein
MREIRTSGLMSGEGKRGDWQSLKPPRPSSTLQPPALARRRQRQLSRRRRAARQVYRDRASGRLPHTVDREAADFLGSFVEEAKASSLIARLMAQHGVNGVTVAAPASGD